MFELWRYPSLVLNGELRDAYYTITEYSNDHLGDDAVSNLTDVDSLFTDSEVKSESSMTSDEPSDDESSSEEDQGSCNKVGQRFYSISDHGSNDSVYRGSSEPSADESDENSKGWLSGDNPAIAPLYRHHNSIDHVLSYLSNEDNSDESDRGGNRTSVQTSTRKINISNFKYTSTQETKKQRFIKKKTDDEGEDSTDTDQHLARKIARVRLLPRSLIVYLRTSILKYTVCPEDLR